MKLTDYKVLTFDCYGTLIDWESGIFTALQPLLERVPENPGRDAALELFAVHETEQERATPDLRYPELLAKVHARLSEHWGVDRDAGLEERFGQSVKDWPAFPDSADALAYLKQHYQLVILSNIDRQSFATSNEKLRVEFDAIYTAEDIGSYKPDPRVHAGAPRGARSREERHPPHGPELASRSRAGDGIRARNELDRSASGVGRLRGHDAAEGGGAHRLSFSEHGGLRRGAQEYVRRLL
jgi:2-haloalkanoic acid dehalogenase type II